MTAPDDNFARDVEAIADEYARQHHHQPVTEDRAAQWLDEGPADYVGRRIAPDEQTGWCKDPIRHDREWRSSELCMWERSRGIRRPEGICPQCGRRLP